MAAASTGPVPIPELAASGRLRRRHHATGAGSSGDVVLDRLEPAVGWCDRAATRARIAYLSVSFLQLVLAAAVRVGSSLGAREGAQWVQLHSSDSGSGAATAATVRGGVAP